MANETNDDNDKTVAQLRDEGFAVIVWSPDELNHAPARQVEDRSVEYGWEVIACLNSLVSDEDEE